ncbi:ABC transporter substrate-binding protein [Peptostreptococcus canis]|uniref:Carbohydrate ABC transporter substrate-binding protein n=1 Tax=Peptostreptococcus canis TaxID=1159213 RepID=A0ABR6TN58_9FIRM|nr:ABC transporter substrate-binding protein [Peptostreptococcus canis]MBC2576857.1 carbohydrate ABC transporter substrate-binding protein [Peptostreptococcus canis]MBP1998625.1 raffinose/stachyose/melibiose transport system substrate-binding protein [Peptostreptococcus canis]
MKFKKIFSLALAGALSVGLLAGCGKSGSGNSGNGDQVQLDVFQFKVEFKDQFTKLADEYMKENPNIKINITTVGGGGDYGAALKSKFSSGNEPAIFNIGGPQDVKDWMSKLEDLSAEPLVKEALPTTVDGVTVDGKVYGLPFNQEGYGFIYNKAVFEKAGIKADELTNYTKLMEAVKKLDSDKSKLGLDAVFALPAKEDWVTGLHLSNVFLSPEFDGNINKTFEAKKVEFKYAKQFKDVLDMQNKYSVQPTVSLDYSQQVEQLFSTGKVAMIQQGNWAYNSIEQVDAELAKNIGILPIPVDGVAEGKLPVGIPMYWAVNSNKDDATKKAAKDFLNWIYTSEKGKEYVINEFKFIPAYKGYDASKISDPLSKTIYEYAEKGNTINWVFMGYPSSWGQKTLGADIQKYVGGKASFDEIVKSAQEAWAQARK